MIEGVEDDRLTRDKLRVPILVRELQWEEKKCFGSRASDRQPSWRTDYFALTVNVGALVIKVAAPALPAHFESPLELPPLFAAMIATSQA